MPRDSIIYEYCLQIPYIGITYRYYIEIMPTAHRSHRVRETLSLNKPFTQGMKR